MRSLPTPPVPPWVLPSMVNSVLGAAGWLPAGSPAHEFNGLQRPQAGVKVGLDALAGRVLVDQDHRLACSQSLHPRTGLTPFWPPTGGAGLTRRRPCSRSRPSPSPPPAAGSRQPSLGSLRAPANPTASFPPTPSLSPSGKPQPHPRPNAPPDLSSPLTQSPRFRTLTTPAPVGPE
jgi:hypothetical protein